MNIFKNKFMKMTAVFCCIAALIGGSPTVYAGTLGASRYGTDGHYLFAFDKTSGDISGNTDYILPNSDELDFTLPAHTYTIYCALYRPVSELTLTVTVFPLNSNKPIAKYTADTFDSRYANVIVPNQFETLKMRLTINTSENAEITDYAVFPQD